MRCNVGLIPFALLMWASAPSCEARRIPAPGESTPIKRGVRGGHHHHPDHAPGVLFSQGTCWEFKNLFKSNPSDYHGELVQQFDTPQTRHVWDWRIPNDQGTLGKWTDMDMFIFHAKFDFGDRFSERDIEIQVNPKVSPACANLKKNKKKCHKAVRSAAEKYLHDLGRPPRFLRKDLQSVTVHDGGEKQNWSSSTDTGNIVIYIGNNDYINQGATEACFAHELTHVTIDKHAYDAEWKKDQKRDNEFVSQYAKDWPNREDVAESMLPWLALQNKDTSEKDKQTIQNGIPHRVEYFEKHVQTN